MYLTAESEYGKERKMRKERYETPDMEVIVLAGEDIITTSGGVDEGEGAISVLELWK